MAAERPYTTHMVSKTLPPPPPLMPTTSTDPGHRESRKDTWLKAIYNKETGEFLYRTIRTWFYILAYSAIFLIFLMTFFLITLYTSLVIVKQVVDYDKLNSKKFQLLTYSERGIGLTAAPTSETSVPLIWYKSGEKDEYNKYIHAIDYFLSNNRQKKEVSSLGPCGQSPYGYGEKPCVIVRINKRFNWAGKPLQSNSTAAKSAPAEVQAWMKADRTKLWLQCSGYHAYDKEHIGRIEYYPDPPGFDASVFPLDANKKSPLVAIQISEYTKGISLAIECKLWYDTGPSSVDFVLYVAPG